MAEAHVVQDLRFDVAFEHEDEAWEAQQRVSDFVQQRAVAIVAQALDEAAAAGLVLRLETLEVDLGKVDPEQLETQWSERLREALQQALAGQRAAATVPGAEPAAPARWLSSEQAELAALLDYLRSGRLPWHVPAGTDPQQLAMAVWRHSRQALQQALVRAPQAAMWVPRLVQQFPVAWVQELADALQAPGPGGRPAWPAEPAAATQRLVQALAAAREAVVARLEPAGPGAAAPALQETPLFTAPAERTGRAAAPLRADYRRLRALLVDDNPALSDDELQDLLALWQRLSRHDPVGLRGALLAWGTRARVRRHMAQAWPPALLQSLPRLWWPGPEAALWLAARGLGGPETPLSDPDATPAFAAPDPSAAPPEGRPPADRRHRWERALAELLLGAAPAEAPASALPEDPGAAVPAAPPQVLPWLRSSSLTPLASPAPVPGPMPRATNAPGTPPLHQARVAEQLALRWPAAEAVALADLACQPLPAAWERAGWRPVTRADRVQWALDLVASEPAAPHVDPHAAATSGTAAPASARAGASTPKDVPVPGARAVVQAWWLRLALQQQRSPAELWQALQAVATQASPDGARARAWQRWLPAHQGLPGVVLAALVAVHVALQVAATEAAPVASRDLVPGSGTASRALSAAVSHLLRLVPAQGSAWPAAVREAVLHELALLPAREPAQAREPLRSAWHRALDAPARALLPPCLGGAAGAATSVPSAMPSATPSALPSVAPSALPSAAPLASPPAAPLASPPAAPRAVRSARRSRARAQLRRQWWPVLESAAARHLAVQALDDEAWLVQLGLWLPPAQAQALHRALHQMVSSWPQRDEDQAVDGVVQNPAPDLATWREQVLLTLAWSPRLPRAWAADAAPGSTPVPGPAAFATAFAAADAAQLAQWAQQEAAALLGWWQRGAGPASPTARAPVGLVQLASAGAEALSTLPGQVDDLVRALRGAGEVDADAWQSVLAALQRPSVPARAVHSALPLQARERLLRELEWPLAAQRLAAALAPPLLLQVLQALRPADAAALQALWPALLAPPPAPGPVTPARSWAERAHAVLRHLLEEGRPLEREALLARAWGGDAVAPRPLPPGTGTTPSPQAATVDSPGLQWWLDSPDEPLFVGNAGLVLLTPYLQRLFEMLQLWQGSAWAGPEAAERAVLLCQYLATGQAAAPEPVLVLNKLLCGVPLAVPVPREAVLQPPEREALDGLLQAVIAHWKALGRTSAAGLRETFLCREGRLEHRDEARQLHVQPHSFDVLLDRLPWGYTPVRFPWMPEVLHVHWK